jgi:hypothetical protein
VDVPGTRNDALKMRLFDFPMFARCLPNVQKIWKNQRFPQPIAVTAKTQKRTAKS